MLILITNSLVLMILAYGICHVAQAVDIKQGFYEEKGLIVSPKTLPYINNMRDELTELFDAFQGKCAVGYVNLDDNSCLFINGDLPLCTASMAKIMIAGELFQRARERSFSFSQMFTVDLEGMSKRFNIPDLNNSTYFTGNLNRWGYSGRKISAWELIEFMLVHSDNLATAMLMVDTDIFAEGLGSRFAKYGAMDFIADKFYRSGKCPGHKKIPQGRGYSRGTAKGYIAYLMDICRGRWCESPAACEMIVSLMSREKSPRKKALLGADMGTIIAQKGGGNPRTRCHAGVCLGPGKRFVFVAIVNPEQRHIGEKYKTLDINRGALENVMWKHTPLVDKGIYRVTGAKGIVREEWIDLPNSENPDIYKTLVYGGTVPNRTGLRLCLVSLTEETPNEAYDGRFNMILANTSNEICIISVSDNSEPIMNLEIYACHNRSLPVPKKSNPAEEIRILPGKAIRCEYDMSHLPAGKYSVRVSTKAGKSMLYSNWLVVHVGKQ